MATANGVRVSGRFVGAKSAVDEALGELRHADAHRLLESYLRTTSPVDLMANREAIDTLIDQFYPKRRRALLAVLSGVRQTNSVTQAASSRAGGAKTKHGPATPAVPAAVVLNGVGADEPHHDPLVDRLRSEYTRVSLEDAHSLERLTQLVVGLSIDAVQERPGAEDAIRQATAQYLRHAVTQRHGSVSSERVPAAVQEVKRFLDYAVTSYRLFASDAAQTASPRRARSARVACSAVLEGALSGACSATIGRAPGAEAMLANRTIWAGSLGYITSAHLHHLVGVVRAEFTTLVEQVLIPTIEGLEAFLARGNDRAHWSPRLATFDPGRQRFQVVLATAGDTPGRPDLEIHCYLASPSRDDVEESLRRNVATVVADVPSDLRAYFETNEVFKRVVVGRDKGLRPERVSHALEQNSPHIDPATAPILVNYAIGFPMDQPRYSPYFLVERHSVRALLRTTEQHAGVRLWCSVRRSGKTTACFDLSASAGTALISQTCSETFGPDDPKSCFYAEFKRAIRHREIADDFVRDTVALCASKAGVPTTARVILVIDEYETLFQRLAAEMEQRSAARFTLAQPLLGQFVAFARENLLVLVGQRPDAESIIPEQNQLMPFVQRDTFPLFEFVKDDMSCEFVQLLSRVVSDRVGFDGAFAASVFRETGGHPYLTAAVMRHMFAWLISKRRRAASLELKVGDFQAFAREQLAAPGLIRVPHYDVLAKLAFNALGPRSKSDMWLHTVFMMLRQLAKAKDMTLPTAQFYSRFDSMKLRGVDIVRVLDEARRANFFHQAGDQVKPRIPVLARLAADAPLGGG